MRKLVLLATAVAAVFGVVAVAQAANVYSVTTARVTPTKAGTATKPKHTTINFGYGVTTDNGQRPSVTTDYVIRFGAKVKSNRGLFTGNKTCTIAQAGYVSGSSPRCPTTSRAGAGTVNNQAGLQSDPTQRIPCVLNLTLYVGDGRAVPASANDGIAVRNDIVLALKGGPPSCPLAVDAALPAQLIRVGGGAALRFHVKRIPFQQPQTGIDNAVVNVTSNTGKSIVKRVRGRRVTRGLFETTGCTGGAHNVVVQFKSADGSTKTATKRAPCRR
jgi:hypothetical protein